LRSILAGKRSDFPQDRREAQATFLSDWEIEALGRRRRHLPDWEVCAFRRRDVPVGRSPKESAPAHGPLVFWRCVTRTHPNWVGLWPFTAEAGPDGSNVNGLDAVTSDIRDDTDHGGRRSFRRFEGSPASRLIDAQKAAPSASGGGRLHSSGRARGLEEDLGRAQTLAERRELPASSPRIVGRGLVCRRVCPTRRPSGATRVPTPRYRSIRPRGSTSAGRYW
jgi:hypothetical protein